MTCRRLSLVLSAVVALAVSCKAEFKSGETKCSSDTNACPAGFTCSGGVCVDNGGTAVDTSDAGSGKDAGSTGTGGTGGAASGLEATGGISGSQGGANGAITIGGFGGSMVTDPGDVTGVAGAPGQVDASVDASTPVDGGGSPDAATANPCMNPMKPLFCPAKAGGQGYCVPADTDCDTLKTCPDGKARICGKGETVNCDVAPYCVPTNNVCPTGRHPTWTKLCPATKDIGPVCRPADQDCATLTLCPQTGLVSCPTGKVVSCGGPDLCVVSNASCAMKDPKFPVLCPGKGGVQDICASPEADCATITKCGTKDAICAFGEMVDCRFPENPCVPIGNKCPPAYDTSRTLFCGGSMTAPPSCWSPDRDCSTLTQCSGEGVFACSKGFKVACGKGFHCAPVNDQCPAGQVVCKSAQAGTGCIPMGDNCASTTVCPAGVRWCKTAGYKVDCEMDACVPK